MNSMKIGCLSLRWAVSLFLTGLMLGGCAPKVIRPASAPVLEKQTVIEVPAGVVQDATVPGEEGPLTDMEFQSGRPTAELPEQEPGALVKTGRIPVLPSLASVDQRMTVYADKMSSWEALSRQIEEHGLGEGMPPRWDECLATIEGMFRGYSVLMEELLVQDHPAVKEDQFVVDPWLLYQKDIAFLEGGCDQVFISAASLTNSWNDRLSDTETPKGEEAVVIQYAQEGRYKDAIEAYNRLMKTLPYRTVGADTSKMYGLALMRTGKFEMAAEVLAGALENMRPSQEERALRRLVADLLLATGKLDKARGHYRKLADYFESRGGQDRWVADQLALLGGVDVNTKEFPLYQEALKGYISFDGRHIPQGMGKLVERMEEDFRESPLTDRARQMLVQLEDSIREWVSGRLDEVDVLMANNDYTQARAFLEQMLSEDLPVPVHGMVQRSMDNLLQTEMKYRRKQRAIPEQTLSAQWDKAVELLDSKKYDEAIETFKGLLNTEYDVPARANIQKAAEAASVEMRRKSATLFVKARKEDNDGRKREFLRESWQLLYDITIKYPEVRLIDKIKQNLDIIEKHIESFDPVMLQELKTDQKIGLEGRVQPIMPELNS